MPRTQSLAAADNQGYEVRLGGATETGSGGFHFEDASVHEGETEVKAIRISIDAGAFFIPGGYGEYYCNEGGGPARSDNSTNDCLLLVEDKSAENLEKLLRNVIFYPDKETQTIRAAISAEDIIPPADGILDVSEDGDAGNTGDTVSAENTEDTVSAGNTASDGNTGNTVNGGNAGNTEGAAVPYENSVLRNWRGGSLSASTSVELTVPSVRVTWHLRGEAVFGDGFAGETANISAPGGSSSTQAADPSSSEASDRSAADTADSSSGRTSDPSTAGNTAQETEQTMDHTGYADTVPGKTLEDAGYTLGTGNMSGVWKTTGTVSNPKKLLIGWKDENGRLVNPGTRVTGDMDLYAVWADEGTLYPTITFTIDGRGFFTDGPEIAMVSASGADGNNKSGKIAAGTLLEKTDETGETTYTVTADRMAACGYGTGTEDTLKKFLSTKQFRSAEYRRLVANIARAERKELRVRDVIRSLPLWDAEKGFHLDYWNTSDNRALSDGEVLRDVISAPGETYDAKIRKITWKITYSTCRGTNADANPREVSVTDPRWKLQDPVREGYDFAGWYTDAAFTDRITAIDPSKLTGDLKLYARWEPSANVTYTVEYYFGQNGRYERKKKRTYTGTTDETVTAAEPVFSGYELNTSRSRVTGTVSADGGLVLKLYYDEAK